MNEATYEDFKAWAEERDRANVIDVVEKFHVDFKTASRWTSRLLSEWTGQPIAPEPLTEEDWQRVERLARALYRK